MPNNILITPGSASIQFSGSIVNTIRLQVEPSGAVAFYGTSGSLVSIADGPTGTLMGVTGSVVVTGSLNATSITSSFISGAHTGTFPYGSLTGIPTGILSSSTQINALSGVSASFATTASAATSLTFVPTTSSFANTASAATSLTFTPLTASFANTSSAATSLTFTPTTASFANTASAATSLTFTPSTASFATTASAATSLTFTPVTATSASTVPYSGVTGVPSGLVSSSTQIDYNLIQNKPSVGDPALNIVRASLFGGF